jgi:hypothetical protein
MRDWFARTFPTIAGWGLHDWIMLLLTTVVSWACVMGVFFNEKTHIICTDCRSLDDVYAENPEAY